MALSDHNRAALWMIFFCFTMACLSGMIRHMSQDYHALELVFFRNLFGLLFMVPLVWQTGFHILKTTRIKLHFTRALAGTMAMSCWFIGLTLIPLSEATALSFSIPIFTTIGAWLFLKEKVRHHRWMAIGIGFLGMLVILRPGLEIIDPGALVVLLSSIFIACALLMVKELSRTEHPQAIVFYMGLFMTPISLIGASFYSKLPVLQDLPWLFAMGAVASIGQVGLANAMRAADASVSMPFNFSHLIFATLIGAYFFQEQLDLWTWVGAILIFGATVYIVRREATLAQRTKALKAHPDAGH